jgi:fibronectin-binding autotransporter adhesin
MRRRTRIGLASVAASVGVSLLPLRTHAALYWDADGAAGGNNTTTGAGLGGAGIWGSASNWFEGVGDVPWTAGSDAVFHGTAGVVTLASPQSANSLTFKSNGYTLTGSTLTLGTSPANYTVDAGLTATIASAIAGSATMTKAGAGTLILSNPANTNTATSTEGGWRIDAGTLRVSSDGNFGIAPGVNVTDLQINQSTLQFAANGEFDINRRTKINTNSSTNLGDAVFDVNEHNVTWYGSLQGGVGSLHVTASNGNGGMLVLGTDKKAAINPFGSTLPAGAINLTIDNHVVVQTSGTVTPTGGELGSETGAGGAVLAIKLDTGGQIRSESGGYEFQRNLILGSGGGSLDTGAWEQTFLGNISGPGTLIKFGTGKLIIDNPPTAFWSGGTVIHSGVFQLGRGGSNGLLPGTLVTPSSVSLDAGATLRFFRGSNKSFFDIIAGGGNVEIANANNAIVRLVSDNSYTGLTTISSGVLMIGQGNPGEPGSIVSNVANNSSLVFNRVENLTYAGSISGSGTVTKQAAGRLTLTGASTCTGAISVSAGTLAAANPTGSATGTGPVSVASGATISGTGTIGGAVTLNSGAHLAPGSSAGNLTVSTLALASSCLLDYELGVPGSSDLTTITSASGLSITGGSVNVIPITGFGVGQYPLLDYTTAFIGSPANLSIGTAPGGFVYSFIDNTANTSIDLVVSVPEPAALACMTALPPLLLRRRPRPPARRASRLRRPHHEPPTP